MILLAGKGTRVQMQKRGDGAEKLEESGAWDSVGHHHPLFLDLIQGVSSRLRGLFV